MNDTIRKFGYPETLLAEYEHWVVLLRPAQATLGSLVLAHKSEARSAAELDAASWAELARVTGEIEGTLAAQFAHEKINYLMLMMVDREVHSHVIPRYSGPKEFGGRTFTDPGWPAVPPLGHANELDAGGLAALAAHLRDHWVSVGG